MRFRAEDDKPSRTAVRRTDPSHQKSKQHNATMARHKSTTLKSLEGEICGDVIDLYEDNSDEIYGSLDLFYCYFYTCSYYAEQDMRNGADVGNVHDSCSDRALRYLRGFRATGD